MTYKQATRLIAPIYDELKKLSTDHDEIVNQLSSIYEQLLRLRGEPYREIPSENYLSLCSQLMTLIQNEIVPSASRLAGGLQKVSHAMNAIHFDVIEQEGGIPS